jgi:hypothetical protein
MPRVGSASRSQTSEAFPPDVKVGDGLPPRPKLLTEDPEVQSISRAEWKGQSSVGPSLATDDNPKPGE